MERNFVVDQYRYGFHTICGVFFIPFFIRIAFLEAK